MGQNREAMKQFAQTETAFKQDGEWTDAAKGVNWAVEQLKTNGRTGSAKAVILIGDGKNDFPKGAEESTYKNNSEISLYNAVEAAKAEGIKVYTIALNPETPEYRQYFANIASDTGGKSYEPTKTGDLDACMNGIIGDLTGGIPDPDPNPEPIDPENPFEDTITVPAGVFEMNLQCSWEEHIDITLVDPNGDEYNSNSKEIKYDEGNSYTNIKVQDPEAGEWKVKYESKTKQTIKPSFVLYRNLDDLEVSLEEPKNIVQKEKTQYTATVTVNGKEVTNDDALNDLDAKICIMPTNDAKTNYYEKDMSADNGKLVANLAIDEPGDFEAYVSITVDNGTIESDKIEFTVEQEKATATTTADDNKDDEQKSTPLWKIIAIAAGILLVLILAFVLYRKTTVSPGTGFVQGSVSLKINASKLGGETMIFQKEIFSCDTVFAKKNTLSDLVTAYITRYRINNPSQVSELSLNQFLNTTLSEVTEKISVCGNKKKQTIIKIPAEYEMQVDDMDITKPKTMTFSSQEKEIRMRFKNQDCTYIMELNFTRA